MIEYVVFIVLIALAASFIVMLLAKWGAVEWMQVHGDNFISKMANCDFCLSFWVNVIIAILVMAFTEDRMLLFVPLFSTMITRKML